MQRSMRTLAPALLILTLALAGCQTPGKKASMAEGTTAPAATGQTAPAADVGFFVAQTEPDATMMPVSLPDGDIFVQRTPVITRADLSEAAALVDRTGKNFVGLRFTESGARKLNDVSTRNVGKLLVLVIDGQIVAAPRIAEPLNRGVLAFSVDSEQTAQAIAARVRGDAPAAAGVPGVTGTGAPSNSSSTPTGR